MPALSNSEILISPKNNKANPFLQPVEHDGLRLAGDEMCDSFRPTS